MSVYCPLLASIPHTLYNLTTPRAVRQRLAAGQSDVAGVNFTAYSINAQQNYTQSYDEPRCFKEICPIEPHKMVLRNNHMTHLNALTANSLN